VGTGQMSLFLLFAKKIKVVKIGNLVDKIYYFWLFWGYLKQI
jgi:hypothetical protein